MSHERTAGMIHLAHSCAYPTVRLNVFAQQTASPKSHKCDYEQLTLTCADLFMAFDGRNPKYYLLPVQRLHLCKQCSRVNPIKLQAKLQSLTVRLEMGSQSGV